MDRRGVNSGRAVAGATRRELDGTKYVGALFSLMKIATFNVNGITSRLPRLLEWLEKESPDIVCYGLQYGSLKGCVYRVRAVRRVAIR